MQYKKISCFPTMVFLLLLLPVFGWCQTPVISCDSELVKPLDVMSSGWSRELPQTRDYGEAEAGLTANDLPKLKLQWAFAFKDAKQARSLPAITRQAIYIGSQEGVLFALDRKAGCAYWRFQARKSIRNAISVVDTGEDALVIFGDDDGYAYAVDAIDGRLRWERELDDNFMAVVTGSPVYHQGFVYFPVSSFEVGAALNPWYNCCHFRGSINKLDLHTGELVWKSHAIPEPAVVTGRNAFGVRQYGPSGAGVWSSPTIDEARQRLYFGTGQNYSSPADDNSDAVHAIDLQTGARIWHTQLLAEDSWNPACGLGWLGVNCPDEDGVDYDIGTPVMLVTKQDGSQVLVAGQKSGMLHALNPESGERLWSVALGRGGLLGGIHWGVASDGRFVYAPVSDLDIWGKKTPGEAMPSLNKVDINHGEIIWRVPAIFDCEDEQGKPVKGCRNGISAALTLIPGAVLAPGLDGTLRAHDTETGKVIWQVDTTLPQIAVNGLTGEGGTLDAGGAVVVDGQLFINSGYGGLISGGGKAGNLFLVYGLEP